MGVAFAEGAAKAGDNRPSAAAMTAERFLLEVDIQRSYGCGQGGGGHMVKGTVSLSIIANEATLRTSLLGARHSYSNFPTTTRSSSHAPS
jgi:hypothetical protein